MDTKDTAETTAPLVAPAKPAPAPKPAGEPEPEEPVPLVPLSGLGDESVEGLRASFSGLSVGGPELKGKEKEKEAVDIGVEDVDPGDGHEPSDEGPFDDKPGESAPSASDYPAVPSPKTTTLPATHPATSSPTTSPPMAEDLGFTGMPYPTYGVTPTATVPPMTTAVSEPHLGFYGVQKSQNQLQSEILLFLSNYTIKSMFSGVSPPPPLQIGNFPAPGSTM